MSITLIQRNSENSYISSKDDLLEYLKEKNFIKINDSLFEYIQDCPKEIYKSRFDQFIQKYQTCSSQFKELFWTRRGYSEEEAKSKIKEIQKSNNAKVVYNPENNPTKLEYYIKRGSSSEEAKIKLSQFQSKNSPRCLIHWLNKGYSEEEAKIKLAEYQNNSEFIDFENRLTNTNLDWYKNKGYSEEESKTLLQERQNTSSREKLMQKYTLEETEEKLYNIKKKKQDTFFSRPKEEQDEINLNRVRKNSHYQVKYFENNPEKKEHPGLLYYFKYTINNIDYWKIGITIKTFNERFRNPYRLRYNIRDIIIEKDTIYNCFIKEQEILKKYDFVRVKTELTTESFKIDINKENQCLKHLL